MPINDRSGKMWSRRTAQSMKIQTLCQTVSYLWWNILQIKYRNTNILQIRYKNTNIKEAWTLLLLISNHMTQWLFLQHGTIGRIQLMNLQGPLPMSHSLLLFPCVFFRPSTRRAKNPGSTLAGFTPSWNC